MKKIVTAGLAAVLFALFGAAAACAADTVGVVDSQKIIFQHPDFDETTRLLLYLRRPMAPNQMELADKQEDESTRLLLRKYSEYVLEFIDLDRRLAAEKDQEGRNQIAEERQERLTQVEARMMEPIRQDCIAALQAVLAAKKITAVLELDAVYYGGTDITEDVIRQLKAKR